MNKTKACTKCKVEYPITSEYWHRFKRNKDGFYNQCKECRNKKNKQHYQENKEYHKQYYQENKEQIKENRKVYCQENKERVQEYHKQYYKQYYRENKEQILADNRQRYLKNKELYRESNKRYRQKNREKYSAWGHKREAKKKKLPNNLTIQEWKETKKTFDNSCAYCGMTKEEHQQEQNERLHQDHFIPLSKGGGYTKENIIPACRSCNSSKSDTDFEEWYPQYEYYSKEREQKILDYMGGLNE